MFAHIVRFVSYPTNTPYVIGRVIDQVVGRPPRRSVRSSLFMDKMTVRPAFPQVPRLFPQQFSILIFQLESAGSMQRRSWGFYLRVVLN